MKFGIDCGHNCEEDTGAVGIKAEDPLTLEIGRKLMSELASLGHSVVNCTPSFANSVIDSLRRRADKANANQVGLFVSIHFNKYLDGTNTTPNPMGTEVYAISKASAAIAQPVLASLMALGFKSRGVKNTSLSVLKNTNMPAILIEVCFLDSQADMKLLGQVGTDRIAKAIAQALVGDSEDSGPTHKAMLRITKTTFLKPSSTQSADLPKSSLIEIQPGLYPVLDFGYEERHFWVTWPDKSKGNRTKHFIFEQAGKIEAK
jgi:N-acetylmuramoyl-L-alanine amidase